MRIKEMLEKSEKTNAELMLALNKALPALSKMADSGDEDAFIEWAMGKALYEFMEKGYLLTDLPWFKGTSYYTGSLVEDLKKAA